MESLGQQFQEVSNKGDQEIDQTLDELIETLKDVAISYESVKRSNRNIKESATKIAVAKDAQDVFDHSLRINQDLKMILESLKEINTEEHSDIEQKHSEEILSRFKSFFSKDSAAQRPIKVQERVLKLKLILNVFIIVVPILILIGFIVVFMRIRYAQERKRII